MDKFKAHMETVHEIYLDFEFLLSIHFVKEEEKSNLVHMTAVKLDRLTFSFFSHINLSDEGDGRQNT